MTNNEVDLIIKIVALPLALFTCFTVWKFRGTPILDEDEQTRVPLSWVAIGVIGVLYMAMIGVAYLIGGAWGVLIAAEVLLGLVLMIAIVWTTLQAIQSGLSRRKARRNGLPMPQLLPKFHQRLMMNFHRLLIEMPFRVLEGVLDGV